LDIGALDIEDTTTEVMEWHIYICGANLI
jgi:hypothetical protein